MDSRTKNKKSRAQIEGMVQKAFAGMHLAPQDDAVREITDGYFNAVYAVRLADGREVILKIAPQQNADIQAYEQNIMATEVGCMCLVGRNPDIPVPEIYFHDDSLTICDANYYFMEKIEGDNLAQVKESLPDDERNAIDRQIGKIMHAINGFSGMLYGYPGNASLRSDTWKDAFLKMMDAVLDDGRKKHVDFGFTYEELRDIVLSRTDVLEEVTTPQLIHWDAWDGNFFVRGGKVVGLVDFERALWGDPLMEFQFRPLLRDGVTESMRGYGKTEFTTAEIMRCQLYTLYLALIMYTECYFRNYDNDYIHNFADQMLQGSMQWLRAQ